ncbi:MAG: hypothetical protein Fur0037_27950 [Planctomycetota bacterium]
MPIDPEFRNMLVCPASRQRLREASEEELRRVNASIREGRMLDRGGSRVEQPVTEGLVTEDGGLLYPIREGIPILLTSEGIPIPGSEADPKSGQKETS